MMICDIANDRKFIRLAVVYWSPNSPETNNDCFCQTMRKRCGYINRDLERNKFPSINWDDCGTTKDEESKEFNF